MQTVSDTYMRLWKSAWHQKEHKVVIAGVEYGEESIADLPVVSKRLFDADKPVVGACAGAQIDLAFIPDGDIQRAAEIRLYTRLVLEDEVSEWIPKGVFYIDTRKLDTESGVLTIHGYDGMLKGEAPFLEEVDQGDWPRKSSVLVSEICGKMGVELDARTELDDSILIPYPDSFDTTCRELLSMVATAHCGNWTMTDTGKLRLVPLHSIPEATNYLVDQNGDTISLGGVRIYV